MAKTRSQVRTAAPAAEEPIETIRLCRVPRHQLVIRIVGRTPLIPHRWSEKAKMLMRDKQSRRGVRLPHEPKDPVAEAEASLYRLPDGRLGMPAVAFKAAMVDAVRLYKGLTLREARLILFVVGEGPEQLVPIEGVLSLREDTPRNSTGVADLRYRYQINDWSAWITVEYLPTRITPESVVWLLDSAGFCGVGDWRPSSPQSNTGIYGQWSVDTTATVERNNLEAPDE